MVCCMVCCMVCACCLPTHLNTPSGRRNPFFQVEAIDTRFLIHVYTSFPLHSFLLPPSSCLIPPASFHLPPSTCPLPPFFFFSGGMERSERCERRRLLRAVGHAFLPGKQPINASINNLLTYQFTY